MFCFHRFQLLSGSDKHFRDDMMPLAQVALAVEGVGSAHPDNIPLLIASNLVGSWDRSAGGAGNNASHLAKYCQQKNFSSSFQSFNTIYKVRNIYFPSPGLMKNGHLCEDIFKLSQKMLL